MAVIPELLFRVSNWCIWLGFLFLGYHVVCLYVATFCKRTAFLRWEKIWVDYGHVLSRQINDHEISAPTGELTRSANAGTSASWRASWYGNPPLVLQRLVDYAARGDCSAAFRVLEEHLADIADEPRSQRAFAGHASRLGLLGTVIGVAQCFSLGEGNVPAISSLGFALATTAVGLIIAVSIEICLQHFFEPPFARLAGVLNGVRDQLCLRLLQLPPVNRPLAPPAFPPKEAVKKLGQAPRSYAKSSQNSDTRSEPVPFFNSLKDNRPVSSAEPRTNADNGNEQLLDAAHAALAEAWS